MHVAGKIGRPLAHGVLVAQAGEQLANVFRRQREIEIGALLRATRPATAGGQFPVRIGQAHRLQQPGPAQIAGFQLQTPQGLVVQPQVLNGQLHARQGFCFDTGGCATRRRFSLTAHAQVA